MCLHLNQSISASPKSTGDGLYNRQLEKTFIMSEPDLLSTPQPCHVSSIRDPVDRLHHMNDGTSFVSLHKRLGSAESTASPDHCFNPSSLNFLERSLSTSFFPSSQMFQSFDLQTRPGVSSNPMMELRKSVPSSQPTLSTIYNASSSSSHDPGFWGDSQGGGCSSSAKLACSGWPACDILSLSDTADESPALCFYEEKNKKISDGQALHGMDAFQDGHCLKFLTPTLSDVTHLRCDESFSSCCRRSTQDVWGRSSDSERLPADSPLLNALLYQEVRPESPKCQDLYNVSQGGIGEDSSTLLSSLRHDVCGEKEETSSASQAFIDLEEYGYVSTWDWETYTPYAEKILAPKKKESVTAQCFTQSKKKNKTERSLRKQCVSPLSLSGGTLSTASSLFAQSFIRSPSTGPLGSVAETQETVEDHLSHPKKSQDAAGPRQKNKKDSIATAPGISALPPPLPPPPPPPSCSSLKLRSSGGGRLASPLVLAHPEEFKNPSSFLKVYGDPLCSHLVEDKKGSISVVRGENGNWGCQRCGNVNYPRRFRCNKCNTVRNAKGDAIVTQYVLDVYEHHLKLHRHLGQLCQPKQKKVESTWNSINSTWCYPGHLKKNHLPKDTAVVTVMYSPKCSTQ